MFEVCCSLGAFGFYGIAMTTARLLSLPRVTHLPLAVQCFIKYIRVLQVHSFDFDTLFLFPNTTAKSFVLHSKQLHLALKVHEVHCLIEFNVSKQ